MRTRSLIISATLVFVLVLALAVIVLAADPFIGTWKMNAAKSKVNPGPLPKSFTWTFTAQENGIKAVEDMVNADGTTIHRGWAAKYDGKEYPVTASDMDSIVLKKLNANAFDYACKKSGKEMLSGRVVVSKDGKTMTDIGGGKDANGKAFTYSIFGEKQ